MPRSCARPYARWVTLQRSCLPPSATARPRRCRSRWALLLLLALHPLTPVAGPAGERLSAQDAMTARREGRVLSLEALLRDVAARMPGELLEAELDHEDGRLVYELRWLLSDGRIVELELDARTGQWRKLKGPRLESVLRPVPPAPGKASP